jgi:hypothetical protein
MPIFDKQQPKNDKHTPRIQILSALLSDPFPSSDEVTVQSGTSTASLGKFKGCFDCALAERIVHNNATKKYARNLMPNR